MLHKKVLLESAVYVYLQADTHDVFAIGSWALLEARGLDIAVYSDWISAD
jgi:hypothetical protein